MGPTLEKQAPKHLALERNGAYIQEIQRAVENSDTIVKRLTFRCPRIQRKSSNLTVYEGDPFANLRESARESRAYRDSVKDRGTGGFHSCTLKPVGPGSACTSLLPAKARGYAHMTQGALMDLVVRVACVPQSHRATVTGETALRRIPPTRHCRLK